jgi:hypothetical protein
MHVEFSRGGEVRAFWTRRFVSSPTLPSPAQVVYAGETFAGYIGLPTAMRVGQVRLSHCPPPAVRPAPAANASGRAPKGSCHATASRATSLSPRPRAMPQVAMRLALQPSTTH